jgi:hypothetical protein
MILFAKHKSFHFLGNKSITSCIFKTVLLIPLLAVPAANAGPPCVSPALIDSQRTPGRAIASLRINDILYVARTDGNIQVYDVSDPANRVQIEQFVTASGVLDMVADDELIYLGTTDGLRVIDAHNPSNLVEVLQWGFTDMTGLAIRNGLLYWPRGFSGIQILNVRDLDNIFVVSSFDPPNSTADRVVVKDEFAFLLSGAGIVLADISDPSNPIELGRWRADPPQADRVNNLVLENDYLYCAVRNFGLMVVDISNPLSPFTVGGPITFQNQRNASAVSIVGSIAYVGFSTDGFITVDITDPTDPQLIESFPDPTGPDSQIYSVVNLHVDRDSLHVISTKSGGGSDNRYLEGFDVSNSCAACLGDIDANGVVNAFDVSLFVQYLMSGNLAADFNGDGQANFFDVNVFLTEFTKGCP